MTEKEKLINWAKQKWENDKEGMLIIIYNELQYVGKFDWPNIHKEVYDYIGVNPLLDDLKHYNDDLKYIDCIPPAEDDEEAYEEWYSEYGELEECGIDLNNLKIFDYYWKSSEDIKYFEEN